ncbi:MAG: RecX family transcriptional regulator [Bacteroidales bacterium]|nr:RecX family transcriptional regulator [Bacteroidales bacterium]
MDDLKNWLQKMQHVCSSKEYCKFDIQQKLKSSNLNSDSIERILSELEEQHYIDEDRYIHAFVHDKFWINRWGKMKIRYALYQKQLPEGKIENALNEITDDEYIQHFTSLAKAKWKSLSDNDEPIRQQKLIRYLMGRGVEFEIAKKIANDVNS